MDIITKLNNKRILIWGYGREGKSTERFIQAHCPSAKTEVYEGPVEGVKFDDYDLVIKSPGIFTTVKNDNLRMILSNCLVYFWTVDRISGEIQTLFSGRDDRHTPARLPCIRDRTSTGR